MHFLNKVNLREKYNQICLPGIDCLRQFFSLLLPLHVLHAFNLLPILFLITSCSSKKVISNLKKLQPKEVISQDKNQSIQLEINYPIKMDDGILHQDHYSAQTFFLLISIVLILCFINSEYPGKVLSLFKKNK